MSYNMMGTGQFIVSSNNHLAGAGISLYQSRTFRPSGSAGAIQKIRCRALRRQKESCMNSGSEVL